MGDSRNHGDGDREAVRVAIIDDHTLMRQGLRDLLSEEGIEVIGEAADGETGVELVVRELPDVVVMDIHMPGISGIEATRMLRDRAPHTRILIFSVSAEDRDVSDAVMSGAIGYLLKDAHPGDLVAGIRAAAAGESVLSPSIASNLLERIREGQEFSAPESERVALTERELAILRLITAGKRNPEIAEELVISIQTVKNHVSNVLAKLQVDNRVQAAVEAVRKGLH